MSLEEQMAEFSLMGRLNRLAGIDYPDDPSLRARIKAYELAFGMQTAVPETLKLDEERPSTQALYGLDRDVTRPFGRLCLAARRMVERGVRFVQIFHGGGGGGAWDAHAGIMANHGQLSAQVDLPIAGLLKDLKQSRDARRDDRRLGHRVRPLARRPGRRPRPPPAGLLRLAGRRRHQGRRRPRRDRRDRLPRRRKPALRDRSSTQRSCTSSASIPASSKSPAASGWRSTTASRSVRSLGDTSPTGQSAGSLDLISRAAGIAGNEPLVHAVHEQIEIFEDDGANQGRLAFRFADGREDAIASEELDEDPFYLSALARRPSA